MPDLLVRLQAALVDRYRAETEIAEKFARASEHYRDNPVALHLRAMNMVYEGLRQKGSMIIVFGGLSVMIWPEST